MLPPVLGVFITGAGKREVLSPIVNAAGKFLVRLLQLETCRKTTVDEYLPADGKCRLSMPVVMKGNEQGLTILKKALLKKPALRILLKFDCFDPYNFVSILCSLSNQIFKIPLWFHHSKFRVNLCSFLHLSQQFSPCDLNLMQHTYHSSGITLHFLVQFYL